MHNIEKLEANICFITGFINAIATPVFNIPIAACQC